MPILKVARMGHPVLRRVADPVPSDHVGSDEIQRLIGDIAESVEPLAPVLPLALLPMELARLLEQLRV